ncbi:nitroreductase family protein [Corynebacterium sp. 335C]
MTSPDIRTTDIPAASDLAFRRRFAEMLRTRRATRAYDPAPLPEKDVREYLGLVLEAPSAFNMQDSTIVAVRDEAQRRRLAEAANGQKQVEQAPMTLVFVAGPDAWRRTLREVLESDVRAGRLDRAAADAKWEKVSGFQEQRARAGLAREFALRNAMLAAGYAIAAAPAFGWSTSPMTGFDEAAVKDVLGLPGDAVVGLLLAVGRGAEKPAHPGRLPVERRVRFDRW